ncbi:MAG: hypothetical protein ACLTS6_12185 [Anaerobutyricum sp.]
MGDDGNEDDGMPEEFDDAWTLSKEGWRRAKRISQPVMALDSCVPRAMFSAMLACQPLRGLVASRCGSGVMRALVPTPAKDRGGIMFILSLFTEREAHEVSYLFSALSLTVSLDICCDKLVASRCGNRIVPLVPTARAQPARYQSRTRAFLPSMVFKKNKKIRPVHKLFCILILMIQMTARNFTKSPEGPY